MYKIMIILTLLLSSTANATPLLSDYSGSWTQGSFTDGALDMSITFQSNTGPGNYYIEGYFDWDCGPSLVCSGRELFTGTLVGNLLELEGYALVNPVSIGTFSYSATVSTDRTMIAGVFPSASTGPAIGTWSAHAVPGPASILILALGLVSLRRRY